MEPGSTEPARAAEDRRRAIRDAIWEAWQCGCEDCGGSHRPADPERVSALETFSAPFSDLRPLQIAAGQPT